MKSIVLQTGGIIFVGLAIGVADAFVLRPLEVERKDPGVPVVTPGPSAQPKAPMPKPDAPQAVAPSPAGTTNFSPTAQDAMPKGHITLTLAKQLFDAQSAIFVDARKMELFEAAHIAGAFKIELHDFQQGDPQILMMIPRDSQVVIYCTGGNCDESEKVAQMMQGSGYAKCFVLHDGLPGWQAMGWPTEQGRGMMP